MTRVGSPNAPLHKRGTALPPADAASTQADKPAGGSPGAAREPSLAERTAQAPARKALAPRVSANARARFARAAMDSPLQRRPVGIAPSDYGTRGPVVPQRTSPATPGLPGNPTGIAPSDYGTRAPVVPQRTSPTTGGLPGNSTGIAPSDYGTRAPVVPQRTSPTTGGLPGTPTGIAPSDYGTRAPVVPQRTSPTPRGLPGNPTGIAPEGYASRGAVLPDASRAPQSRITARHALGGDAMQTALGQRLEGASGSANAGAGNINGSAVSAESLTPAQQRQAQAATEQIKTAGTNLDHADGDKRDAATVGTADAVDKALRDLDPAVQAVVLQNVQPELEAVGRNMERLDPAETDATVASLSRGTESVGMDRAPLLTDAVARGLPEGLQNNRGEFNELNASISDAVKAGDGSLFGASLTLSLDNQGKSAAATEIGNTTSAAIDEVHGAFTEAQDKVDQLNGELAAVTQEWQGVFTEEEVAAGQAAFREEHKDAYAQADSAGGVYASSLDGAAMLDAHRDQVRDLPSVTPPGSPPLNGETIAGRSRDALLDIPRVATTPSGAAAVDAAVMQGADGTSTFITQANKVAGQLEGNERAAFVAGMDNALARGLLHGQEERGATEGGYRQAPAAFDAYARASGSPDFARGYEELADTARASIDGGANAVELGIELAKKSADLAEELADVPAENRTPEQEARAQAFKVIGAGVATATFIQDPGVKNALDTGASYADLVRPGSAAHGILKAGAGIAGAGEAIDKVFKDPSLETVIGAVERVSGAGSGLAAVLGAKGAGAVLGKVSTVAGAVLSGIDAYQALGRGDVAGAAVAGAPLIGAGIGFAVGGPAGATIGYAVGSVVTAAVGVAQGVFGEDATEEYEKRTESFLEGALTEAGLPADAAGQLRDVNRNGAGAGRTLEAVAHGIGVEPRQLLEQLVSLPEGERRSAVKDLLGLPTNRDEVDEAVEKGLPAPPFRVGPVGIDEKGDFKSLESFLGRLFPEADVQAFLQRLEARG